MRHSSLNIHERFLRHIWNKQYLSSGLQTSDGQPIQIFHVGRLNTDSGPDFVDAKIKIGNIIFLGDVEIHRTAFDWLQHQHQEDPHYNKVVLHVVLEAEGEIATTLVKSGRTIPVLVLSRFLSESIQSIWQKAILDERARKTESIPCFHSNSNVPTGIIEQWLLKLFNERVELKLRKFEERLKQLAQERKYLLRDGNRAYSKRSGEEDLEEIPPPIQELTQKDFSQKDLWEQIVYEGIMEGLGYSKNCEPFLNLARNVTLQQIVVLKKQKPDLCLEAFLFGVAGLLPPSNSIKEKHSRSYVRVLRRHWSSIRHYYRGEILHEADWQFFPTRPFNFPTIRIAAATEIIHLFQTQDFLRILIQTLKSDKSSKVIGNLLISLLDFEPSGFWQHHYSFQVSSPRHKHILGKSRTHDIVINTILPIALLYARIFKDQTVHNSVIGVYNSLPASSDNSVTRFMDSQLLRKRILCNSVSTQQSIIHLYKYYCLENACSDCAVHNAVKLQ